MTTAPTATSDAPALRQHDVGRGAVVVARTLLWVGAVGILALLVWALPRGFDLTDEGFYLLNYEPGQATSGLTRFGPLVRALALGSVPSVLALRVAHLVAVVVGAGYLATGALAWVRARYGDHLGLEPAVVVPATFAVGAVGYVFGPPTLSYNHLAALAAQLMLGAALRLAADTERRAPSVVLGLAATMLLLVKFTALPFVAVLAALVVWRGHPRRWWRATVLAAGVAVAALVLYALVVEPLPDLVAAARADLAAQSSGTHATGAVLDTYRRSMVAAGREIRDAVPLLLVAGLLGVASARLTRGLRATLVPLALVWAALVARHLSSRGLLDQLAQVGEAYLVVLVALGAFAAGAALGAARPAGRPQPDGVAVVVALTLLPLAAAFGTNNALLTGAVFHLAPWAVLAMLAVAPGRALGPLRVHVAAGVMIAVAAAHLWNIHIEQPYRLPAPMPQQTSAAPTGSPAAGLYVDAETLRTLRDVAAARAELGSPDEVLVLYDLPGVAWLLDARAPGIAWLRRPPVGETLTCERLLAAAPLTGVPVLLVRDAPVLACLDDAGVDLDGDYERVATVELPSGRGTLDVYRPRIAPSG